MRYIVVMSNQIVIFYSTFLVTLFLVLLIHQTLKCFSLILAFIPDLVISYVNNKPRSTKYDKQNPYTQAVWLRYKKNAY